MDPLLAPPVNLKGAGTAGRRVLAVLCLSIVAAALVAPNGLGFSGGITKDNAPQPDVFEAEGCVSCHGDHAFAAGALDAVTWAITDADGNAIAGNAYAADATYTITITLDETNAPEAGNRAGFNIRASAGTFAGVDGSSQASGDGTEATHVDAASTEWTVTWTAPHEGPAVFDLLVNDVDGSAAPDPADMVYRVGFWLTDSAHAVPGAVSHEEEHVEFGVSLQQYWLGLIALAGMTFVMIFTFIYMRTSSPHNTDKKDR